MTDTNSNSSPDKRNKEPEVVADPEVYLDTVAREIELTRIMSRPVTLTWWLLITNVVFWLSAMVYGWHLGDDLGLSTKIYNAEQLTFYTGMKVNEHIAAGQWWRIFSSQFVHLDSLHIFFNGYGLFVLGPILERFYGARRIFVIYILSGTAGALASYFLNEMPSGGASGAIYGLVGALLVFGFKYRKSLPPRVSKALTVGLLPWVGLSLGIGFLDGIPMDNAAHLGGLFTGAFITLLLASRLRPRRLRFGNHLLWACTIIGALALLWTAAQWSNEITKCTEDRDAYLQCYSEISERL